MLGKFEVVERRRPIAIVQPGTTLPGAPYLAVERDVDGPGQVSITSGDTTATATWDGVRVTIDLQRGDETTHHVSRRHGRAPGTTSLALSLTGRLLTAWSYAAGGAWAAWRSCAKVHLDDVDVHDPAWLAALTVDGDRSGVFGQLGLRDLRVVSGLPDGDSTAPVLLTATSAGPAGFASGHTSVWSLDRTTLDLTHRGDLFVRRPGADGDGVYGDHASHLLRDGDDWLFATSTWGDFDKERHPHVGVVVARTPTDLTRGTHVLDATPVEMPTTGLTSVGVWDPHLVRRDDGSWLATYVSATEYFRFHPVVAEGPDLDALTLRAAASDRVATEGPTLHHDGEGWCVLASDGRDGPRGQREAYPVFDLDLRETGSIDAFYPTNIPWPTLVRDGQRWLMVGFNGVTAGGELLGYGTHGQVVIQSARA